MEERFSLFRPFADPPGVFILEMRICPRARASCRHSLHRGYAPALQHCCAPINSAAS
jgi:hypothetical protein